MSKKLFIIMFILILFIGCEKKNGTTGPIIDPPGAEARVQLAYESLENQFHFWFTSSFNNASDFDRLNFQVSNTLFKEALNLNPNNLTANFGAAITEILVAYSDTAINNAIKRWEKYINDVSLSKTLINTGLPSETNKLAPPINAIANNIVSIHKIALQDPPLISEVQKILRERLLPRINYALDRLTFIEKDTTFKFRVSGKMQGDPLLQPVYLYITEVFLTDALLQGAKVILEEFFMYRFDLPNYSQTSLINALSQNNTNFFVLASDGLTRAQNAKAAFNAMLNKTETGIRYLETISGYRNDAAIKIGNKGIKQADLDSLKFYLQKTRTSLTSPVSILLKSADSDGNDYTIQVFIGKFFDNPAQNPKSQYLPTYIVEPEGTRGVRLKFTANTYSEFNFPDPTFGGIFPGMTNENLKRILFIDEEFAYNLSGYAYDANYNYISNATIKIQTAIKTYTKQTDQWGYFRFLILDQNNVHYRIFINYGIGDIELGSSQPLIIKSKTYEWRSIYIPQPHSLTLTKYTNPLRIYLSWQPYGYYVIQRSTGVGSTPVDYDSTYYYINSYSDYNVSSGITYRYRVRTRVTSPYYYWELIPIVPLYSNIATITP